MYPFVICLLSWIGLRCRLTKPTRATKATKATKKEYNLGTNASGVPVPQLHIKLGAFIHEILELFARGSININC